MRDSLDGDRTESREDFEDVLALWFGTLDADGRADAAHAKRWWTKDSEFDDMLRDRFGALHDAVANGERDHWLAHPRGRLAFVIVLDQFSRNMFRATARAFTYDARALEVALEGIDLGEDQKLARDERSFLYMPLMHSENLNAQERCVVLFGALRDELPVERRTDAENAVLYAERHRDIIRTFGRFPHRNAVLGRKSSDEEAEFLKQPGSSF